MANQVVPQGPITFPSLSICFDVTYGLEANGSKISPIFTLLCQFSPFLSPKKYDLVTSLQPGDDAFDHSVL